MDIPPARQQPAPPGMGLDFSLLNFPSGLNPVSSPALELHSINETTSMTIFTGHEEADMSVNAAEFKSKCLKLIDQVASTHEPLVITKRGKPMARLVPIECETPASLFGYMKNTGQILGDIVDVPHEPLASESGEEDDLYAGLKLKKKG